MTSDRIMVDVKEQLDTPVLVASQTEVCEMGTVTLELTNIASLDAMTSYDWHHVDIDGNDVVLQTTNDATLTLNDVTMANAGTCLLYTSPSPRDS